MATELSDRAIIESIPVERVQIDSSAALQIIRHGSESFPAAVTGELLGTDIDGILHVTYSFPFPTPENAGQTSSSNDNAHMASQPLSKINSRYSAEMIKRLSTINVEPNKVGFYLSSSLGSFYNSLTVETLIGYNRECENGSIIIVLDPTRSCLSGLSLKAFRLSKSFLKVQKGGKFTTEILVANNLTYLDIFDELPVDVVNSHLVNKLICKLDEEDSTLSPDYQDVLNASIDPYLEQNVELILDSVDDYYYDQGNYQYYQRQVTREQAKINQWIAKTKSDNVNRQSIGQPLLSLDGWKQQFKLPTEPSRLESLLISGQLGQYCSQIEQYSATIGPKLFGIQKNIASQN